MQQLAADLHKNLIAAGLPILSVSFSANPNKNSAQPFMTFPVSGPLAGAETLIGIDWTKPPTPAQINQAATLINAFDFRIPPARQLTEILTGVNQLSITDQTFLLKKLIAVALQQNPGFASESGINVPGQ